MNTSYKLLAGEERPGKAIAGEIVGEIRDRIAEKAIPGVGDVLSIIDVAHEIYDDASKDQGLPSAILNSYFWALNKTGNSIGDVLYNKFGVGALPALKLPSTTAGGSSFTRSTSASSSAGSQSLAGRTAASSTQPIFLNPVQATPQSSPTISNPNMIHAGQTLTIPSGGGTTSNGGGSPTTTYTVRAGDTLGNIGYNFGSSATAIGQANGIQNLNLIHPGQVLTIPRHP